MERIYICGKVTGLPMDEVHAKFKAAERFLEQAGFAPFNPVGYVAALGLPAENWHEIMRLLIVELMDCRAIYCLPCWSYSRGAVIERFISGNVGIRILEAKLYQDITPDELKAALL